MQHADMNKDSKSKGQKFMARAQTITSLRSRDTDVWREQTHIIHK
jgi:hypothetical protein